MPKENCSSALARLFFLLGLLFGGPAVADSNFDNIVVFGDSLSDPGNAFALTGQISKPPYDLIPSAPYAVGGLHFSNGATWVEVFARELKLRAGPAYRNPHVFSNYALGSARARAEGSVDLSAQVSLYLANQGGHAAPTALYVLFIGGNDLRDALQALGADPQGAASAKIVSETVAALADNIAALSAAGARHMIVFNGPDLSLVPAVRLQGPAVQGAARFLSEQYNLGLASALDNLAYLFPDLHLIRFDLFSLFNRVVAQPESFGLRNVADTCINPGAVAGAICKHPKRYLFWDGIHPTRSGHRLIANAVEALIEPDVATNIDVFHNEVVHLE